MAKDPKKVQSRSSEAARRAANKGVKHGTVRMGKAGRTKRMWNSRSARWERVDSFRPKSSVVTNSGANRGPAADFVVRNVSPKSSNGSAKTSGFDWGYGSYNAPKIKLPTPPKDWGYGR